MTASTFPAPAICVLALLLGIGAAGCSGGGTSVADLSSPVVQPDPPPVAPEPPVEEPANNGFVSPTPGFVDLGLGPFSAEDVAKIGQAVGGRIHMGGLSLRVIEDGTGRQMIVHGDHDCGSFYYCEHPWEEHYTAIGPADFEPGDTNGSGRVRRAIPVPGEGEILARGNVRIGFQPRGDAIYGINHNSSFDHLYGWTDYQRFGVWSRDDLGFALVDYHTSGPSISGIGGDSRWYYLFENDIREDSSPGASATYDGHMLGLHNAPDRMGILIHGDATLRYDLDSNSMNVRFHDIVETKNPSRSLQDIVFPSEASQNSIFPNRLLVGWTGIFEEGDIDDDVYIRGYFFGRESNPHGEVGGIFQYHAVSGAFAGAKREE